MSDSRKHSDKLSLTKKKKKSVSMHEDVPVWYDCCSCEAEPYWEQMMQEQEAGGKEKQSRDD
jgi:hypothetical protein